MMSRTVRALCVGLALGCFLAVASAQDTTTSQAEKRSATDVIKELDALKPPPIPTDRKNQDAVREYLQKRAETQTKRAALIFELYRIDPDHERVPDLMIERWASVPPAKLEAEVDDVLARVKSDKLQAEGAFAKVRAALSTARDEAGIVQAIPSIERFLELAPKDARAGQFLYMLATSVPDETKRKEYEDRLLAMENSPYAEMMKDTRWRRDQIGKPFELKFEDAVTGSPVSIEGLKGKVVVIDFWATWCGPCIAEMPKMKSLYAEYKDKGVEFIGVSLDQPKEKGGLDKLKDYVAKNEVQWPQYYQGNYWQSEFSSGWKVKSIPCVFVVDQNGNLYSTEARGKLHTMIPELLKKSAAAGAGG